MKRIAMSRESGNVGELMITGICILAMLGMMLAYMDSVSLLQQKEDVGQVARKYILRMETTGCLLAADRALLMQELMEMAVTEIDLTGTTVSPVAYGAPIILQIKGKLEGKHDFSEKRVSTAKN